MATTKPFVALACFCENLLAEQDNVLSAIRIIDTLIVPPVPPGVEIPEDAVRGLIVLKGLISLKCDTPLSGSVHVIMHRTTGDQLTLSPPEGWPVEMRGDHSGVNIRIQLPLAVKNFGLIWFDVLWNDEILSRMPLMLQQGEAQVETTAESSQGAEKP